MRWRGDLAAKRRISTTLNKIGLAPLYDLVCTRYYPQLSPQMAMSLGGEKEIDAVRLVHFDILAKTLGLSKTALKKLALSTIEKTRQGLIQMEALHPIEEALKTLIDERCVNLSKG